MSEEKRIKITSQINWEQDILWGRQRKEDLSPKDFYRKPKDEPRGETCPVCLGGAVPEVSILCVQ